MDIMLFNNNASGAVAYFNMNTCHGPGQKKKKPVPSYDMMWFPHTHKWYMITYAKNTL
jgi:hypothetical protein